MKIACLIFMMIGSATLAPRIAYAVEPDQGAQQAASDGAANMGRSRDTEHAASGDGKASERLSDGGRNGRHGSDKNRPRGPASLTKANRLNQPHNNRERSTSANAVNLHAVSSNRSSPNVVRPAVPSLNNVRHRAPNPPVIGGAANSERNNTGAINGTRMNRKP